jgi:hypothetical protein
MRSAWRSPLGGGEVQLMKRLISKLNGRGVISLRWPRKPSTEYFLVHPRGVNGWFLRCANLRATRGSALALPLLQPLWV